MKITTVYGTQRKGCTYHIAQEVISHITDAEVTEIFLPRDLPEYCISCFRCFSEDKGTCTHGEYTVPIREKLLSADLIILTSPVYSFYVSGQMKVFLDHFANMWIVHRPEKEMFCKQGLVIATASGPVYRRALNEMKDSLDLWGVARTHKFGAALFETRWDELPRKTKSRIARKAAKIAAQIQPRVGKAKPSLRVRKWFYISLIMQKYFVTNPPDAAYWKQQGWLSGKRPWKNM